MKNFSLRKLFDNNRFVVIFALLIAVVSWITVAMTTDQTLDNWVIKDVPVKWEEATTALQSVNLIIVNPGEVLVDVTVSGPRTVIGRLDADDISIVPRVSGITQPQTGDLVLVSGGQTDGYDIAKIEPGTVWVQLDDISSKEFTIIPQVRGVSTEADYMLESETVSPGTLKISGPQSELEKIKSVAAILELDETLASTITRDVSVTLLNAAGDEIIPAEHHLTLSIDTVQLVITVFGVKQLPLMVNFTNVPTGFPLDDLRNYMYLSDEEIWAAGPVNTMNNYYEIPLGYIDMTKLTPQNSVFPFPVPLPDAFKNLNNITTVTVEFESDFWDAATFNVTEIETYDLPYNFNIELLTYSLPVTFVGDSEIIAELAVGDIKAEVFFSDKEVTAGTYNYPVRISAPDKGLVWPVGDFSVVIRAEEILPETSEESSE